MSKKIIIVESPSKAKTIEKYLGNEYRVVASAGHIRNLSTKGAYGLGIDIENNFTPDYTILKEKKNIVSSLKKEIKDKDHIYLATDPDREGEAISWHLKEVLEINDNYSRLLFNEITKDKIIEAINNPLKINYDLVKSQETRVILDKIIGFRLSDLIRRKSSGKSAGRVQSVALKLIVDREREINEFNPEEYWKINAIFKDFEANLFRYNNKDIKINNEKEADDIISKLDDKYNVKSIEEKEKAKKSKFPYITSSLQQDSSNKLNFNAKKTMKVAQKLYEGISIKDGLTGLITYMRTDSIRLSDEFIKAGYKFINDKYGKDYIGYVKKAKKNDNVQDAHEAIRPTDIFRTPEMIKEYLTADEYKLYRLIYYRTLASLMADAKVKATTIILDNNKYEFKATGQVLIFDGYLKVYSEYESSEDKILPELKKNTVLEAEDIVKSQHFTEPPSRYTEASLIKEMEELGIGRPSTYATIIDTIKERKYADLTDKKFIPTKIGIEVTDKLQEYFHDIINIKYTANMESDLDRIAENEIDYIKVLKEFYDRFEPILNEALKNMKKDVIETGKSCPECGSPLVIRQGKYGEFTACSKYPDCKYVETVDTGEKCPECGSALIIRKGKYGEFKACSNYPKCKYIQKEEKVIKEICKCPNCEGMIIEKTTRKGKIFYGCSNYPKCKTATWDLPTGELCNECNNLIVIKNNEEICPNCNK